MSKATSYSSAFKTKRKCSMHKNDIHSTNTHLYYRGFGVLGFCGFCVVLFSLILLFFYVV